uniref:MARVEL domain-containing protein n=1 Tax=Caenorhabditis tropicalis TaxID=1561998 RepID=A0A1I7TNC3_9PELO
MYYDERQRYNGERYYPRHDPFDSPPRISHIHTNVHYGGPASVPDMDIAKTFDHEPFRHSDPKYKCLCNKMHVKQGCKCILAFLVIVIIVTALLLILNWNIGTWTTLIIHAILLIGIIACAFALFLAMKTEKEKLLLPVAGIAVLGAIISIIFLAFTIWSLIDPTGPTGQLVNNFVVSQNGSMTENQELYENREDIQTISAITIVIALAALAASIWVAFVVYKYYMYLKDMKFARVPKNQVHIEITDLKKGINQ